MYVYANILKIVKFNYGKDCDLIEEENAILEKLKKKLPEDQEFGKLQK